MKRFIISSILFCAILLPGPAWASAEHPRIYSTSSGAPLGLADISRQMNSYDVIIFGEYHDNTTLHKLEKKLLTELFARYRNLTVSLEMFERDVAKDLNAYLAGNISEEVFLEKSRPWKNYAADYRPLVEFAKENSLRVLAANIPRRAASHYARQGTLDSLPEELRPYLPQFHSFPGGEYKQRFYAQMEGMSDGQHGMKVAPEQIEAFYRAQCLKDDTMAESIVEHLRRYPSRKIIHYQGDFHSRYRLGVVTKIRELEPSARLLVITPAYVETFDGLAEKARSLQADGDIVVFVKQERR